MTKRDSHYGSDYVHHDFTRTIGTADDLPSILAFNDEDEISSPVVGESPLLRLTKKPSLVTVPPPHNAAALAGSEYASANLPVVNVHAKKRRVDVRGH